jgi:hypothetical protein
VRTNCRRGEVELLTQSCRVVDLLARIDDQLVGEDLTVPGSRGQERAHPLLGAAVEQRRTLEGLLKRHGVADAKRGGGSASFAGCDGGCSGALA